MATRPLRYKVSTPAPAALNKLSFASPVIIAASWAILFSGVGTIFCCAYMMVATYSPLPFWDGWLQVMYGAQGGNPFTLDWIWSQYNDCRMPIPKLFLLADLHWFHATQVFLLGSIFVILFLQLLLFAWMLRALGGWRGSLWRTGVGLAAFCLFNLAQWENLTWGSQVCFVFPGLFASLAFIGLLLYWTPGAESGQKRHWRYLLLSITGALGATWCFANGNLLWPMLVIAALFLRLELRAVVIYVVTGTLSTALYMYGYIRPASNMAMGSMLRTAEYLAAYFGSSWVGTSSHYRLAECIGVLGIGSAFFFALRLRLYVEQRSLLSLQLVLLMLFSLASGAVTAFGRSQFGISQAFTSRYQTVALLFWCCLGLLVVDSLPALKSGGDRSVLAMQIAFLVIMAFGAFNAGTPLIRARVRSFHLNAGAAALATDVTDQDQLHWVYWGTRALNQANRYIRENRLSIYEKPIFGWLRHPLSSSVGVVSADQCSGQVESTTVMGGSGYPALRITGWAWDNKRQQPPVAIIAATQGTITGLGAVGDFRPMQKASRNWMGGNYLGYTAYLQNVGGPAPIEIYAILKGSPSTACLVGTVK